MSDDSRSDSGSESEDLEATGLVATRAKRATAGNLYATLRANLDDEELQKELLAEDETDAGDYEGSDKDAGDDDEAFDSSSEDEDAGPPAEGQAEDLDGEKALKKQERADARKKRKMHDARLKLPAWRKQAKRVKLVDDSKADDASELEKEKKKKKSERSNWLPTPADAPMRQSVRSLAVANREVVHANLKQSAARSEKQKRIMKSAAEREKVVKVMASLTQEERLKKCERIERETAKEFGRWEREEAERQRLREEALAAKRKRGFDGPVIRHWSGSVLWEGERIRVKRLEHGSQRVEEIIEGKEEGKGKDGEEKENEKPKDGEEKVEGKAEGKEGYGTEASTPVAVDRAGTASNDTSVDMQTKPTPEPPPVRPQYGPPGVMLLPTHNTSAQPATPWLNGIQEYAAHPTATSPHTNGQPSYTPSAPTINAAPPQQQQQPPTYPPRAPQPQMYHGWPPSAYHTFTANPQPPPPPQPPAPVPLIRQQAQRSLVILSSFPSLEQPPPTKRTPKSAKTPETTPLDPTPLTLTLLPSSHPTFTPPQRTYLLTRPRRRAVQTPNYTTSSSYSSTPYNQPAKFEVPLPPAPTKERCALTSWPAKFRDPKTGVGYADLHQYKALQRVLAGGCAWSRVLGGWVGPRYGGMGRPARGVPEGFAGGDVGGNGVVKGEGAS